MRLHYLLFLLCYGCFTSLFANQLITEPDAGRKPILEALAQSRYTIDLVMYGMTDETLLTALTTQKARDRSLKIILEQSPFKAANENHHAILTLQQNAIPWHGNVHPFKLIHQKTLLIDNDKALVFTFNFTKSAFKNDRNFGLIIDDKKIIRALNSLFSADWNNVNIVIDNPHLVISPNNSREKILDLINKAHQSISIYAASLSDFKMVGALASAAREGVKIKILTSSHLQEKQKKYLNNAHVLIRQSKKRYIHAKVMVIDNHIIMLGSLNFTRSSFDLNREVSVILEDKNIAQQIEKTFTEDWRGSEVIRKRENQKQLMKRTFKWIAKILR